MFAPTMPIVSDRVMQIEHAIGALVDPWRTAVVLVYIERVPEFFLRRQLRRRWRINDPAPIVAEALRRVAAALTAQHVLHPIQRP